MKQTIYGHYGLAKWSQIPNTLWKKQWKISTHIAHSGKQKRGQLYFQVSAESTIHLHYRTKYKQGQALYSSLQWLSHHLGQLVLFSTHHMLGPVASCILQQHMLFTITHAALHSCFITDVLLPSSVIGHPNWLVIIGTSTCSITKSRVHIIVLWPECFSSFYNYPQMYYQSSLLLLCFQQNKSFSDQLLPLCCNVRFCLQ